MPVPLEGAYWMRAGEDLVPMTPDMLQRVFAEAGPDFSAEICAGATTTDLDVDAIDVFRRLWAARSGNSQVETRPVESFVVSDHIAAHDGRSLQQLMAAFPDLTRNQLQSFLKQLRAKNAIHPSGATRAARWLPGPSSLDGQ
jgi:hypothetical protein